MTQYARDKFAMPKQKLGPNSSRLSLYIACLYVASIPFEIDLVVGGRSAAFWLGLLLCGTVVLDLLEGNRQRAPATTYIDCRALAPLFVLLLLCFLSTFWSINPGATLTATATLAVSILTTLALAVVAAQHLPAILGAFAISSTAMSSRTLLAPATATGRADTLADSNDTAAFIIIAVVILIRATMSSAVPLRLRVLAGAGAALNLAGILATGSRTAIIAFAVSVTILLLPLTKGRRMSHFAAAVALVAMAIIAFRAGTVSVPERIQDIPDALREGELSNRDIIWQAAGEGIPTLLGIGFAGAPTYMHEAIGQPMVTHSLYFGVLLELGVIGLAVWTWCAFAIFRPTLNSPNKLLFVAMGVSMLIMASTLTLETRRPLWLMIALCLTLSVRHRNRSNR